MWVALFSFYFSPYPEKKVRSFLPGCTQFLPRPLIWTLFQKDFSNVHNSDILSSFLWPLACIVDYQS